MKKRIIQYMFLLMTALVLFSACGNKMNGTYSGEKFGVNFETKIKNKKVTLTLTPSSSTTSLSRMASILGDYDDEDYDEYDDNEEEISPVQQRGTINSKEQYFEFPDDEKIEYEYEDGSLILYLDGAKVTLHKK